MFVFGCLPACVMKSMKSMPVAASRHSFFVYGGVSIHPKISVKDKDYTPFSGTPIRASDFSAAGGGASKPPGGRSSSSAGGTSGGGGGRSSGGGGGKGPGGSNGSGDDPNDPRKRFPKNEKVKIPNYENHHIIPQQLKDHPLLKLAGFDIHSRVNRIFLPKPVDGNFSRPEAAAMSAEERKKLPPNERRSFHQGSHDGPVIEEISENMDARIKLGKANNWTELQYNNALREIISVYRQELKQGNIALNSHHRTWTERLQKPNGGK